MIESTLYEAQLFMRSGRRFHRARQATQVIIFGRNDNCSYSCKTHMNIFQEYKKTLKDPAVEEFFDLFLFRPFAFLIVKTIRRFPITPNQLSVASMITGIGSGIFFSLGTKSSFLIGGFLYGFTRVMDCSDGMLARMKNCVTPTGRIVDGIIDYVNASAVNIGWLIGLFKGAFALPVSPWLLVVPAAFFMGLHSMVVDYYRMEFLSNGLGKANSPKDDYAKFTSELDQMKSQKKRRLDEWMIRIYLLYLKTQLGKTRTKNKYDREAYFRANRHLLPTWAFIGSSSYIFVLMTSSIIGKPMVFFCYSIGIANIWLVMLLVIQIRTNNKLTRRKDSSS